MNSEQLKTFLLISETKSFSRTAKILFIAQSSVSKRIVELEKEVGQPLFKRSRSGVSLTNPGKLLKKYAEQTLNMEAAIIERMHHANQHTSHLTIGTVYAYYNMHLSRKIIDFSMQYPEVPIHIRFGHTAQLLSDLTNGILDIAFTHRPIDYSDYVCKSIGHDDIILITDARNTASQSEIAFSRIKELPLIDTNFLYAPTRKKLFPPFYHPQISVDVASSAVPLLHNSKFFALLPKKLVAHKLNAGILREVRIIGDEIPPVNNYMIYRKEKDLEPQDGLQKLVDLVQKEQ